MIHLHPSPHVSARARRVPCIILQRISLVQLACLFTLFYQITSSELSLTSLSLFVVTLNLLVALLYLRPGTTTSVLLHAGFDHPTVSTNWAWICLPPASSLTQAEFKSLSLAGRTTRMLRITFDSSNFSNAGL